ncbi:unnamed protein product [Leptidea sinapis]|uniref:Uncharacterized protein n=1 Tax=Leptidea sinapis TaxID=189913 RepID=A0A5E4R1X2_9NEOP|nr:unnamed protein product [Leptidea sinapis]
MNYLTNGERLYLKHLMSINVHKTCFFL